MDLVTLQKLLESMPQRTHAVIKAKGDPAKILVTFFWPGSVVLCTPFLIEQH